MWSNPLKDTPDFSTVAMTTKEPKADPLFTKISNTTDKPLFTKDFTTTDVTFTGRNESEGPSGKPPTTKDFTSTQMTFTDEVTSAIKLGKSKRSISRKSEVYSNYKVGFRVPHTKF